MPRFFQQLLYHGVWQQELFQRSNSYHRLRCQNRIFFFSTAASLHLIVKEAEGLTPPPTSATNHNTIALLASYHLISYISYIICKDNILLEPSILRLVPLSIFDFRNSDKNISADNLKLKVKCSLHWTGHVNSAKLVSSLWWRNYILGDTVS